MHSNGVRARAHSDQTPADKQSAGLGEKGHSHQTKDSKPLSSSEENYVQQDSFDALQDSAVKVLPESDALIAAAAENRAAHLPGVFQTCCMYMQSATQLTAS